MALYHKTNLFDFAIYWNSLQLWLKGEVPYQYPIGQGTGNVPFNYPPASFLFFYPLHFFNQKVAELIFTSFSVIAFISSIILTNSIIPKKLSPSLLIATLSLTLMTFPFRLTLALGQINCYVLFFIVLAYIAYKKNYKILAAFLLSVSGCLKLYPLVLLITFAIKKELKIVILTICFFVILNLIYFPLFPMYFLKVLPNLSKSTPSMITANQSIFTLFYRVTNNHLFSQLIFILIFAVLFIGILRVAFTKPLIYSYFSLITLLSITGQFSWLHHAILTYPFIFIYYRKQNYMWFIFLVFCIHLVSLDTRLLKIPYISSMFTILVLVILFGAIYGKSISRYILAVIKSIDKFYKTSNI